MVRLIVEQKIAKVAKILRIGFAQLASFCELVGCVLLVGAIKRPADGLSVWAKESS